jgi:ferrous iron transport protein B
MCISTLATIKRETNSWAKMSFATFYLFALAYLASFATYQVAVLLGAG